MQIASLQTVPPLSKPSGFLLSRTDVLQNGEIVIPNGSKIFRFPVSSSEIQDSVYESWILVVDSQAELAQSFKQIEEFDFEVDIYWLRQDAEIAWTLANVDSSYKILGTLETPSFNGVRVSKATAPSSDSQVLRTAMLWTDSAPRESVENAINTPEIKAVFEHYHSLLLFEEEARLNKTASSPSSQPASTGAFSAQISQSAEEADLSALLEENAKLKIQLANSELKAEALGRKYKSLSNSKLGRLTLKYWDLRR